MRTKLFNITLVSVVLFVPFVGKGMAATQTSANPVADPKAIIESGDMRFTVLTPQMIRIEWRSDSGQKFVDDATFAVINRRLPVPAYKTEKKDGFLYITTDKLKLQYRMGSFPGTFNPASSANLKITFDMDGRTVTWYPWKKDALNLKGTCRTLDSSNGDNKRSEMGKGLVSRSGWAVIDETETHDVDTKSLLLKPNDDAGFDWVAERPDKKGMDWYFLGYGHNYKQALYDFTKISGKIPMPPLYAFGYWYSKYQDYSPEEFYGLVNDMEKNDVPIDVMVVDMNWHGYNWTGWSWNKDKFPNPKEFLDSLHKKDLKVTLNLHPADGVSSYEDNYAQFAADLNLPASTPNVPWNLENEKFYKSLFKNILRPNEQIGVDFWWIDWQQSLFSKNVEGLGNTFWCNYVFFNDMAKQYPEKRALIFHRWGGLGNHRYQLGFSGDSHSNFPTLAFQPYFTATAANVGYGYWGHDLGGHYQDGPNNPELYLRWIQFGVFSPILRTHSSNSDQIERRIWMYPNFPLMKEAFDLRYSLVPYIYTQARHAYDTGLSICRPLYYDNPEADEAYTYEGEYMFGNDILVNPITKASTANDGTVVQKTWLPKGLWYDVCRRQLLDGNGFHTDTYDQNEIPYFYKAGAVIPNYPKIRNLKHRPQNLIIKFVPGDDGETRLYEDANDTEGYKDNECAWTHITQTLGDSQSTFVIHPIEGQFEGMPTQRSYTVEILSTDKPSHVSVNGQEYPLSTTDKSLTWTYDETTRTITVNLPTTKCDNKIEIVTTRNTSSVTSTERKVRFDFCYNKDEQKIVVTSGESKDSMKVAIYDAGGKAMGGGQCTGGSIFEKSVADWSEGIYLCKVSQNNQTETYTILK